MITLQSRLQLSDDVLFQEVDGEAVLLDLRSEEYFSLNVVGAELWRELVQNPSLAVAHTNLLDRFEVEAGKLEADLLALAVELSRAGLIQPEAE